MALRNNSDQQPQGKDESVHLVIKKNGNSCKGGYTLSPTFQKSTWCYFAFVKGPHQHVFDNWKKSEENFCCYERGKNQSRGQCAFCRVISEATHSKQGESPHQAPPPGSTFSISASSPQGLNCVRSTRALCMHIYFMHPLARYVLRFCFFALWPLGFRAGFIGMLCFWIVGNL